jgi:acetyl esterase/lipase
MASRQIEAFMARCRRMPSEPPADPVAARAFSIARDLEEYPALPEVAQEQVRFGEVEARWYRPPGAEAGPLILYFHGGGFMWSSAEGHGGLISRVAAACGAEVLALDYRTAPASRFPGPVEEGVSLYRALIAEGRAAKRIAFIGDSAGGGLAMSVLQALKASGDPLPACAAVSSAWLDMTQSGESLDWVTADPCVHRAGLEVCREAYLQGHDPRDPLASPLFADPAGLPTLLIQAGSREQLLSDSIRLASKADAAGVAVELEVYDGCMHLWHWWVPDAPEAKAAIDSIGRFVRSALSS